MLEIYERALLRYCKRLIVIYCSCIFQHSAKLHSGNLLKCTGSKILQYDRKRTQDDVNSKSNMACGSNIIKTIDY